MKDVKPLRSLAHLHEACKRVNEQHNSSVISNTRNAMDLLAIDVFARLRQFNEEYMDALTQTQRNVAIVAALTFCMGPNVESLMRECLEHAKR
jgi:hypothetical protein